MIGPSALTTRVDRLVSRGFVTREVDPDNRRHVLITLTPAGLELVDRVAAGHYANEDGLLAALGPAERADLAAILRALLASLDDTLAEPAAHTHQPNRA